MEKTRQWERVKELFEAGLKYEPGQRSNFLRDACGADDSLLAEVESLLSAYAQSDHLSQNPWPSDLLEEPQAPQSIGPYRLVKKIGEGGMGQVWLAEQTAPLQRQVALKLIRTAFYDKFLLHRFQAERQSLAIMDHPAIAKVFDAGATPEGQPYFVMEYVPGEPVTEYCDQRKLTIRERLELFVKLCEGVQHAHQKAVIHRDLKPANILVVELDGKATPRIIDFGLAKAVAPSDPGELVTRVGGFVGTLGYTSPEQADPSIEDIDTRTDVYSLGVILYELLTGRLPFDTKQWPKQPLDQVLRQLREEDPLRPSTKSAIGKESAALRGTVPKQLARLLQGDLDWITIKALEKDRGRRYGTPSELAADITRYLQNEPVVARPASAGYRLQKYFLRHRVAASAASGLVVLLAGFAGVEAVQLRRITRERDWATRERDRASRITDFMTAMFKVSDPGHARGNSITAREILDKASKDIDTGLEKDPELQAQMMYVMGKVYDNLGIYTRAEALFREAAGIRQRLLGEEDPQTLSSKLALAWTLYNEGRYTEAEKLERRTLDLRRRLLGPQAPETVASMGNLAVILNEEGHHAEAESLQRQVLEYRRRVLGPQNPDTLVTINNLALVLENEGHYSEAEKLDRQALDGCRRSFGPDHPLTLESMTNLAIALYRQGRDAEAEQLDRETLERQRRVLGLEHPQTLKTVNNLTAILNHEGKYAEAEKLERQTLDIRRRVLGPEHPLTLDSMNNLADVLTKMGQYAKAEKLLLRAQEVQRRVLGPDHPMTAISTYNLACVELDLGRTAQALSLLRESIDHGLPTWVARGMAKDEDLKLLHGDPRFAALVTYAKERAAATQKT